MAQASGIIASKRSSALEPCLLELLEFAATQVRHELEQHFQKNSWLSDEACESELQTLYARLAPIQDQIINTPAQNIEGILVKLRLLAWCREGGPDEIPADGATDGRAIASLLIDMRTLKLA